MGGYSYGPRDYYAWGQWNVHCSMCGRKLKSDEVEKNWMGQYRCPEHNEPRQAQDFVRGVPDDGSVPFAQLPTIQPRIVCTLNGTSAIPGYSIPGCMTPGRTNIDPTLPLTA